MKCGSSQIHQLSRIERNMLNNFLFDCQHKKEFGCQAIIKYEHYRKHLTEECVHKIELEPEKEYGKLIDKKSTAVAKIIQDAHLANLFLEEGEEPVPFVEWVAPVIMIHEPEP